MKKIIFLFALLAAAASCAFAQAEVVTADDAEWGIAYTTGGIVNIADDGSGGVYVYSDNSEAFLGLVYTSENGWLLDANPGDTLTIDFTVTGIIDDPVNRPGEGIDYLRNEGTYATTIFFTNGDVFPDPWIMSSETVNNSTVTTFSTVYEFTDTRSAVTEFDFPLELYPVDENDGSVSYNGSPAFKVSAPVITITRATPPTPPTPPTPEVVPEPASAVYAIVGLLPLIGIKRRIKK